VKHYNEQKKYMELRDGNDYDKFMNEYDYSMRLVDLMSSLVQVLPSKGEMSKINSNQKEVILKLMQLWNRE
jgi:hypothetical protein